MQAMTIRERAVLAAQNRKLHAAATLAAAAHPVAAGGPVREPANVPASPSAATVAVEHSAPVSERPSRSPDPLPEPESRVYSNARRNRTRLVFDLRSGRSVTGFVVAFGRFTVEVETAEGPVLVYKNAILLVRRG
jgi:sRNA-binding regulator protein Hfq